MGVSRRRPQRPGRQRASAPSATATKAALIGFERWYSRHLAVDGDGHLSAGDAVALLTELFERSRGALHAPVAPVLEDLLAAFDDDPELASRLPAVIQTLEHYLDFAVETGTWPATDDEIDESSELLEVAFELSTELLGFLVDSLDEVDDVPVARARAAFEALPTAIRTPVELLERLRAVLGAVDPVDPIVPAAVAVERVIGLLCVAADPGLLPGRSEARIRAMLDTATGVTVEEARAADPDTTRMLGQLERDGLIRPVETSGITRYETPADLRPALADAIVEIADELGLVDDDTMNPHPEGSALQVKIAVLGTRPAVWRRLLLAAHSDLGELHLAAQLSLDWDNDEAHEFTLADEPDVAFTSIDRIGEGGDAGDLRRSGDPALARALHEDLIDENDVQLGELLAELGDEIRYRYGQAEPRDVVIRLEQVVEPDGRALPRAVGASAEIGLLDVDGLLAPLRLR